MNRKYFIKSLTILCAAPHLIANISAETNITLLNKVPKNDFSKKIKICGYWKISAEMFEDEGYMDWLISKDSNFVKDLYSHGFDLSKPYNIQIGYEMDDFVRNLKTCIISQFK